MGIPFSRFANYHQLQSRESGVIFFEDGWYRRREPSVSPDGLAAPSPPTHYLLSSAVEIVTRQRVAEQLENLLLNSEINHINADVEDVDSTDQEQFFHTSPSHLHQRSSRSRFSQQEIIDRNQYNNNIQFSSLYELFAYLLQSNEFCSIQRFGKIFEIFGTKLNEIYPKISLSMLPYTAKRPTSKKSVKFRKFWTGLRLKENLADFTTKMLNEMSSSSSSDDDSDITSTMRCIESLKKTFLSPWETAGEMWHMNEAELQQLLVCQKSLAKLLMDVQMRSFACSYCADCTSTSSSEFSDLPSSEKLRRWLKRAAEDFDGCYEADRLAPVGKVEKSRHLLTTGHLIAQVCDLNRRMCRLRSAIDNALSHRASLVHLLHARECGIATDHRRLTCGWRPSGGVAPTQPKRKSTRSTAKTVGVSPKKSAPAPSVEVTDRRLKSRSYLVMACHSRAYPAGFTATEKVMLNNDYLPNQMRIVDSIQSKTFCVSFIDDGKQLITASQDYRIRRYVAGGRHQRYILHDTLIVPYVVWSIIDTAVSPDGRHLIYSTWNEPIYQYDFCQPEDGWKPLRIEVPSTRYAFFSLRFSVDGREIVAGANNNNIFIYDREATQCVLSLPAHEDDVNAVCFGDTAGHLILTAGDDGLCKASLIFGLNNFSLRFSVWDRRTIGDLFGPHPIGTFAGHRDGISFIDSRGDDRYVLTNSKDQTIKLWDMRVFASEKSIEATRMAVSSQDWDYRYHTPYSSASAGKALEGDCSVATLQGHFVLHTLVRARFSPEHTGRRYVYTGCARGNCIVYDLLTGETAKIYSGHASVVRDCIWHPHRNEIVTSSWDGRTYLWRYDQRRSSSHRTVKAHTFGRNATEVDSEDSCDENYQPIRRRRLAPTYIARLQRAAKSRNSLTI